MKSDDLYRQGDLRQALAAATEEVKNAPSDLSRRGLLAELLCFAGELDRADRQLDTLGHQSPEAAMGIGLFRHLIRAEQARQQFFAEGRLPEFLDQPSPILKLHLEASIRFREGEIAEAARLLQQAEEQRPHVSGTCDSQDFEDLRDLDDLLAPVFEVLTSNGKYYWIPIERVESIEFRPPARPRDLLWRRAHMIVRDGPDGEVFLPVLYAGSAAEADDRLRLGRSTDWRGDSDAPIRGLGQRTFLVGDEPRPVLELQDLTIRAASAG